MESRCSFADIRFHATYRCRFAARDRRDRWLNGFIRLRASSHRRSRCPTAAPDAQVEPANLLTDDGREGVSRARAAPGKLE
jgi:hypothetical protein